MGAGGRSRRLWQACHAAGNLVDELTSTVVLADMWLAAGHPSKARRLHQRALEVSEAHGDPVLRATPDLHVGLSEMDYEVGDLEAANRHLERAAALGEAAAMTESRYRWFMAMGLVAHAEGDRQEAITLLDKAEQRYRPGFPDVRPIAAMKARVWITHGNLSQAADWAHERGAYGGGDILLIDLASRDLRTSRRFMPAGAVVRTRPGGRPSRTRTRTRRRSLGQLSSLRRGTRLWRSRRRQDASRPAG